MGAIERENAGEVDWGGRALVEGGRIMKQMFQVREATICCLYNYKYKRKHTNARDASRTNKVVCGGIPLMTFTQGDTAGKESCNEGNVLFLIQLSTGFGEKVHFALEIPWRQSGSF